MGDWNDHDWIRRLQDGDEEARGALWQELFRQAKEMARWRGQSEDIALDATEKAYYRILNRGIYQYRYDGSFINGFCPVIVVRELLRVLKRAGNVERRLVEMPPELNAPPLPPQQQAILALLRPCLDILSVRDQQILLLIDLWEMPPQEVAESLDIRRDHVNVLAFRARRKVKECMEQRGYRSPDDVLDS